MKKITILFCLLFPFCLLAQGIHYDIEPNIANAQQNYTETWKKIGKIKVYVVQVCSFTGDNSSAKAQNAVNNLAFDLEENSTYKAYVTFQEPTFKVRIGDFMTRAEAYGALLRIQEQYPGAFVTTDLRKISEIIY